MNPMTLQQAKDQICYHHYGEMYKWHELFPDNKLGLYDEVIELFCQSQKVQAYKAGYEKRICEQIDLALSGQGQNSGYNKEQLEKNIEAYLIETKKD